MKPCQTQKGTSHPLPLASIKVTLSDAEMTALLTQTELCLTHPCCPSLCKSVLPGKQHEQAQHQRYTGAMHATEQQTNHHTHTHLHHNPRARQVAYGTDDASLLDAGTDGAKSLCVGR